MGGGLAAGFALALGILYLLMLMDQTFHTERDVEICLKLPVLTTIPLLEIPEPVSVKPILAGESLVASK